jgi:hypothetical protein
MPGTLRMDGLRYQLFAGAAFAQQEHTGLGRRYPADMFRQRLHRYRATQQTDRSRRSASVRQTGRSLAQPSPDPIQIQRLGQIVCRPQAPGIDDSIHGRFGHHGNNGHFVETASGIKQTQTAAIAQMLSSENDIRPLECQLYGGLPKIVHRYAAYTFLPRHFPQQLAADNIFINDQQVWHTMAGKKISKMTVDTTLIYY